MTVFELVVQWIGSLLHRKLFPHIIVLVVEDEPDQKELYENRLRKDVRGLYIVQTADEALACFLKNTQINLVIVDIGLPQHQSGLWLMGRLKEVATPERRYEVIVLTGSDEFRKDALERGAKAYLLKPVSRKELLDAIERVVGEE